MTDAKSYLNCQGLTPEVSEENLNMLLRNHCDILVKKVTVFCKCLKNLCETKVKSGGLILLAEKYLKTTSINSVLWL